MNGVGAGAEPGMTHVVVGSRPWCEGAFVKLARTLPGRWVFIQRREDLTFDYLSALEARYVWVLHWSWKVPPEITERFECVAFHMADLPYGRGGSPLQNLILRGHTTTRLAAFRLTDTLDAGPVYLKEDLSLDGAAEAIYTRASGVAADMICRILREGRRPVPQTGEEVVFLRRTPAESRIDRVSDLRELYDFIRMLDATGYPRAFFEHEGFRFEFGDAALSADSIQASVRITRSPQSTADRRA